MTHHWATANVLGKPVANGELLRLADEDAQELVVHAVLYVHTRPCRAILASVVQDAQRRPFSRCRMSSLACILAAHFAENIPSSRLALSKTRCGDLPPSSSETFFRLLSADAFMTLRPVTVLPVKATLSMPLWEDRAAPPTEPSEGTVFTTPGGNLSAIAMEM